MKRNTFLLFICFLYACSSQYEVEIETVMKKAGRNRKELEAVLRHYGKNPADSLKLRAAEFLIVNMPGQYSEYYDAPWNDVAAVYLRWTSSPDKQMVLDAYKLNPQVRKDDLTYITANYLINNIELAFRVWREQPWGKQIPFDVFCEEILPYRVSTEPLENWREKVLAGFADLYQSFTEDTTGITTVEACSRVNDKLPRFRLDKDYPPMNYSQSMATTRGICDHYAALTIFVMRGLGIPVTCDFTPRWTDRRAGHSWNSVRDSCGKHVSFMGTETNPEKPHFGTTLPKSKAYRYVFVKQQNVMTDSANIPPLLRQINNAIDVTSEYDTCVDVHLSLSNSDLNRTGYAFLSIPFEMEWNPVGWGKTDADSVHFLSAGKNILYLPVYYNNGIQTPASCPFLLEENGSCRFFRPDSLQPVSLTMLARTENQWLFRMKDAVFEVANRSDFSDAKKIHTIETSPGPYFHTVSVTAASTYRYVRYVSPANGHCNVSILEFYDENDEKLQGTVMGETPKGWLSPLQDRDKAFDGDVDTFTDAVTNSSWIGLDLGERKRIAKLRYLPRTDGAGIYEGHVYELFYWDGDQWHSLGKKTADSHILHYDAPANALFLLKNWTKNKMNRIPFFIEEGVQKWY